MQPLPPSFFAQDTLTVAKQLLGKIIEVNGFRGRIIETEAYKQDKASHARTRTERSALMHDTHGYVYVYIIYGIYHCLNFTSSTEPGAVLIRAVEPLNTSGKTDGPGKLCREFNITKQQHNGTLVGDTISVFDDGYIAKTIQETPRIGIKEDTYLLWRFTI